MKDNSGKAAPYLSLKSLLVLHAFFWTLVPALAHRSAPLGVVEGFAWGREWHPGSYEHPPLQAWLLEITRSVTGTSGFGYFGLAALCSAIALWAVFKTAELVTDRQTALIATTITQSILYFTFLSTEFNPNSLQLMFWALAGCLFVHALIRKTTRHWLALGLIFAAGFYSKYFMALCGVSFVLFMLTDTKSRHWFMRPQPYAALLLCALLVMPHLVWLQSNDQLPFPPAASPLEPGKELIQSAGFALDFAGAQAAALLPALVFGALLLFPLTKVQNEHEPLIRWLAFAPLALLVAASFLLGVEMRSMWGMPILTFIPLWLVMRLRIQPERLGTYFRVWSGLFAFALLAYAGNQMLAARLGFKSPRGQYPGPDAALHISEAWRKKTSEPLTYVVGDRWEASTVAFYSTFQPRPHVWIYGTDSANPWIDEADVLKQGAMIVWKGEESGRPGWVDVFVSRFPGTVIQPNHLLTPGLDKRRNSITLGSAILQPQP